MTRMAVRKPLETNWTAVHSTIGPHEKFNNGRFCEMTICPLRREATSICRTTFGMIAKLMFATLTVIVTGGCAGNMQAIIRGEGTPVVFSFEQEFSSDFYSAEIDGERFTGRAVMAGASSAFSSMYGSGVYLSGSSYVTTGNFKATLLGDRGSTLRCLMQYASSGGYTPSGGVGECVHSDGRFIDVVW